MLTRRERCDAALHTLRSVATRAEPAVAARLESARYHLYAALEADRRDDATQWLAAVRIAVLTAFGSDQATWRDAGVAACDAIAAVLHS